MPPTPLTMNHLDRIRQDRELIGLENFKSLSLDQLLDAIDQNFPTGLGRKRMIQTFITWLHDCLVDSEISDGPALRSRVRDWVAFLRKCQNSDRTILDTFREYQNCELIRVEESKLKEKEAENPRAAKTHIGGAQAEAGILKEGKAVDSKNKKRAREEPVPAKAKLSIIAIELEKYLNSFPTQSSVSESTSAPAPGPPVPNSTATSPRPNSRYGYMHPDRMPTLSGSRYNSTLTDRMGTPPGPRSVRKQPEKVTPRPGATFGNMHLDKMPLLSKVRTVRAHPNDKAPPPEGQYGQMHPDRMKISQKLGSETEMNCDGDLQTAGFSSRNTSGRSDNFHNEHLGLKKNLSFLTGSNRMVLDDTMRVRDPTLRSKNKSTGDDSGHEAKRPRLEEKPRVGGRSSCGLCGGGKGRPSFLVQQITDYSTTQITWPPRTVLQSLLREKGGFLAKVTNVPGARDLERTIRQIVPKRKTQGWAGQMTVKIQTLRLMGNHSAKNSVPARGMAYTRRTLYSVWAVRNTVFHLLDRNWLTRM